MKRTNTRWTTKEDTFIHSRMLSKTKPKTIIAEFQSVFGKYRSEQTIRWRMFYLNRLFQNHANSGSVNTKDPNEDFQLEPLKQQKPVSTDAFEPFTIETDRPLVIAIDDFETQLITTISGFTKDNGGQVKYSVGNSSGYCGISEIIRFCKNVLAIYGDI